MFIKYNPNAFGQTIVANSNVTVQRGEILASYSDYEDPMPIDNESQNNIISIVAGAKTTATERFGLGSTPKQFVHVKIKIVDCNALPELYFTFQELMAFEAFYYEDPTGSDSLFLFNDISASDTENQPMCGMSITGLSPTTLNGGVGDILTITGHSFGTTPGTVQMKNCDDGGVEWISLDDYDIDWHDSYINVKVPSTGPLYGAINSDVWHIGSGKVKVITDNGDIDISDNSVQINYSWQNYSPSISPPVHKDQVILSGQDSVFYADPNEADVGYLFHPSVAFLNDTAAFNTFEAALNQWSCATDIRWELDNNSVNSTYIEDTISTVSFGTLDTNVIGETQTWIARCFSGLSEPNDVLNFVFDIDVRFSNDPAYNWFYDATGTLNLPPNRVDFFAIALHELGHGHLLMHVNQPEDLMYHGYSIENSEVHYYNRRILISDADIEGGTAIVNKSINTSFDYCNVNGSQPHKAFDLSDCTLITDLQERNAHLNINFTLYPNPFINSISILSDNVPNNTPLQIVMRDINGRTVFECLKTSDSPTRINTQKLDYGLYILSISYKNQISSYKVVKIK